MIDFENKEVLKLRPADDEDFSKHVSPMFVKDEYIIQAFRSIRDGIIFTNKRMIVINIQGVTGKKKVFTSLPYNRIQAYSVETAGVFDLDSLLELWFCGMGKIRFEFVARANVYEICRVISENSL